MKGYFNMIYSVLMGSSVRMAVKVGAVVALMVWCGQSSAFAGTYSWTNTVAGTFNWNTSTFWVPAGYPNAIGEVAYFTNNPPNNQNQIINLNQATITVGALTIGDFDGNATFTIASNASGGKLIFDNGGSGATLIQTGTSRGDTISTPIQCNDSLTVSNASATYPITISGTIGGTGNLIFNGTKITLSPLVDYTLANNVTGAAVFVKDGARNLTFAGTNVINRLAQAGITGGGTLTVGGGLTTVTHDNPSYPWIFGTGAGNTLVVTNGARLVVPVSSTPINGTSGTNTIIITGSGSVWDGGGSAPGLTLYGYNSQPMRLLVTDGGVITNVGLLRQDSGNTSIVVSNGGQVYATSADMIRATLNTFWVGGTNAAGIQARMTLSGANGFTHSTYTCISNTITVAADGILTAAGAIGIGRSYGSTTGSCNSLIITNGGLVRSLGGTIGTGTGCFNNWAWVGGTNPVTGAKSTWDLGNSVLRLVYNGVGEVSNMLIVAAGGIVSNASAIYLGDVVYNSGQPYYSMLIVTNGGSLYAPVQVGQYSSSNSAVITGNGSLLNNMGSEPNIGRDKNADGNTLRVDGQGVAGGAILTNVVSLNVGSVQNAAGNHANGNSMIITNGGKVYTLPAGINKIGYNSYATQQETSRNSLLVTGAGSGWDLAGGSLNIGYMYNTGESGTGNVLRVESGAVVTNAGAVIVGYAVAGSGSTSNSLTVGANSTLLATSLTVGSGAGTVIGNSASIAGLLEANALVCGATGNTISNIGGVYQFTTAAPTITPNDPGSVALADGVISFRNVTNANVRANWVASLTNISFSGVNTFRLNNATNNTVTNQTYTFNNTGVATNYAGLEMVNGGTAYTNGSVTIGTAGWLTFSNTAAIMWGAVTNYGTMRIVNSSVIFKGNLTLGEGCTNYWTTNSTAFVNGTLTLPTNATLVLSPEPKANDQVMLFGSSTNIVGSSANWTVVPNTFKIARGVGGTNLVARAKVKGLVVVVE